MGGSRGREVEAMRSDLGEERRKVRGLEERCRELEKRVDQLQRENDSLQEQHINQVRLPPLKFNKITVIAPFPSLYFTPPYFRAGRGLGTRLGTPEPVVIIHIDPFSCGSPGAASSGDS